MAAGGSTSIGKAAGAGKPKGSRIVTKGELDAMAAALGGSAEVLKEKLSTAPTASDVRALSAVRAARDGGAFIAGGSGAPTLPSQEVLERMFDFRVEREGGDGSGKKGWRTTVDNVQVGEGYATIAEAEKTKGAMLARAFTNQQQELKDNLERRNARTGIAPARKDVPVPVSNIASMATNSAQRLEVAAKVFSNAARRKDWDLYIPEMEAMATRINNITGNATSKTPFVQNSGSDADQMQAVIGRLKLIHKVLDSPARAAEHEKYIAELRGIGDKIWQMAGKFSGKPEKPAPGANPKKVVVNQMVTLGSGEKGRVEEVTRDGQIAYVRVMGTGERVNALTSTMQVTG